MKKAWILAAVGLLAVIFALGAVACSDDDDDDGDSTPSATDSSGDATEPAGEATELTDGETEEASESVDVALSAVGDSGVTGTATLLAAGADGDSIAVEIVIDGGLTEGEHQNHIHGPGTCEAPADVEQALTPLQADASGAAEGETAAVPGSLSSFTDGNNYIAIHATDGSVVACGNIPTA